LTHPYNFKSLGKLANFALIFSIVVSISIIAENIVFEFVTLPPDSDDSLLSYYWIHPTYIIFDIITWGVYIISMVTFFWWVYRANKNIHTFGAREVYSPRMSVIWFLIPLLNLRNGYESVKQIWTASNHQQF
jgi:heme/copper-type cytochrome/quinol oxidase subunit 2